MTIGMEEAKQLPVGSNASRDFTAVVDIAPSASRDAAGISLAGTTGAESVYTINGGFDRWKRRDWARVDAHAARGSNNYNRGIARAAVAQIDELVQRCYDRSLSEDGSWHGRATLQVEASPVGIIDQIWIDGATGHPGFERCLTTHLPTVWLPSTDDALPGMIARRYAFHAGLPYTAGPPPLAQPFELPRDQDPRESPVTGRYAEILELIDARRIPEALELADVWHELFPGDPMALLGLGHALAAVGDLEAAARACGGLADLHPSRADIRRYAGNLLESLAEPALDLAIDNYRHAIAARPDQPSSYRMLAFALARSDEFAGALDALEAGLEQSLPGGRYAGVGELMREDFELVAAVWLAREPERRKQILARVVAVGGSLDSGASTRFVLTWETDANDVDLHVRDRSGDHAYYNEPALRSGGRLLADVTTGFGPEGFVIPEPRAFPYSLAVHYYNQGTSGHGMGQVQIVSHDGKGELVIENRPFVLMRAQAELDLGEVLDPR
jgi:tetratricopeptide (TPR) repeat protein